MANASADRRPCACLDCPCSASVHASRSVCVTCSEGFHRPSREIQAHLDAGLRKWLELMPATGGSSGLSRAQLRQVNEAWLAWHAQKRCPVPT